MAQSRIAEIETGTAGRSFQHSFFLAEVVDSQTTLGCLPNNGIPDVGPCYNFRSMCLGYNPANPSDSSQFVYPYKDDRYCAPN
jgi:hypothetical protein